MCLKHLVHAALRCALPWLAAAALAAPAAPAPALLTILDGPAVLVREGHRLVLAEGVRLQAGDLIDTGADTRIVRIELPDGGALSLGPDSHALFLPRLSGARGARRPAVYLRSGWLKTALPFASPAFDAVPAGPLAFQLTEDGTARAFAESAAAQLWRSSDTGVLRLKAGEYLEVRGNAKAQPQPRPAAEFLAALPRPFLDTLPPRAAAFAGRTVVAHPQGEVSYTQMAPWLDGEPALRLNYLQQWAPLARRPDFHTELVVHLARHPEWTRVLFPDQPPPASSPARGKP